MIANSKEDFLFQLHNELHRIGIDDDADIFADFEEHFNASANIGISEEETCRRLGDVKEIARNYVDIRSSRLNSMIAHEVESNRPRVSLTKPGQSVPADLSIKPEADTPIREYTPEHIREEEAPAAASQPLPSYTPEHLKSEEIPKSGSYSETAGSYSQSANTAAGSTANTGANNTANGGQSLTDALGAAGKAVAAAAAATGHAVADAFNREEVKNAGRSMADAVRNAGNAAAEAVKNAAEQVKAEQAKNQQARAQQEDVMPNAQQNVKHEHPRREHRKESRFESIRGRSMNINVGKLIGQLLLDVLLWSWLLSMLVSLNISIYTGGAGMVCGLFGVLFGSGLHIISRVLGAVALGSFGIIVILLGVLLTKGLIAMIKNIVWGHVKALYDL